MKDMKQCLRTNPMRQRFNFNFQKINLKAFLIHYVLEKLEGLGYGIDI